jgi:hypothetical protein
VLVQPEAHHTVVGVQGDPVQPLRRDRLRPLLGLPSPVSRRRARRRSTGGWVRLEGVRGTGRDHPHHCGGVAAISGSRSFPTASSKPPEYHAVLLRTDAGIPAEYRGLIVQAGTACRADGVSPPLIAARLKVESDLHPNLRDPEKDESGIARWTPGDGQQIWYVIPDTADWNTMVDWIVQRALPAHAPAALRRVGQQSLGVQPVAGRDPAKE